MLQYMLHYVLYYCVLYYILYMKCYITFNKCYSKDTCISSTKQFNASKCMSFEVSNTTRPLNTSLKKASNEEKPDFPAWK